MTASLCVCERLSLLMSLFCTSSFSGSTCGSNSGSLSTCLWACFGKFSIYVDYEDLRGLIEGFGSVSGALDRAVLLLLPLFWPSVLHLTNGVVVVFSLAV